MFVHRGPRSVRDSIACPLMSRGECQAIRHARSHTGTTRKNLRGPTLITESASTMALSELTLLWLMLTPPSVMRRRAAVPGHSGQDCGVKARSRYRCGRVHWGGRYSELRLCGGIDPRCLSPITPRPAVRALGPGPCRSGAATTRGMRYSALLVGLVTQTKDRRRHDPPH